MEDVLPGLLEKSLDRGWSVTVMTAGEEAAAALDHHLWTYADDSFLPHGRGEDGAGHPIWITPQGAVPSAREVLFLVAGAVVDVEQMKGVQRTVVMFGDREAADARSLWKEVKAASLEATYWRQSENGRWEKAG